MLDDEDKPDEEKFDFTPEGEVLAYISLDRARVLAMEHARDNRDFYGRRYARRDSSWGMLAEPARFNIPTHLKKGFATWRMW